MSVVTWDSVNKGNKVTLSNGNLTAVISNSSDTVRASVGKSSGKWYWEVKINSIASTSGAMIGIVDSNTSLTTANYNTSNVRYYSSLASKYVGNVAYGTTYGTGSTISVLLDLDIGTIEFWTNGFSQGIAFTDLKTLGVIFPAVSSGVNTLGNTNTVNFGATPFQYEIPKGYYSYDGSQYGAYRKALIQNQSEYISISNSVSKKSRVPIMTSDSNGKIRISASSSNTSSYSAWKAFNGSVAENVDAWLSASLKTVGEWVKIDFGEDVVIPKYRLTGSKQNYRPTGWKLQGSVDELSWIDLDERSGEVFEHQTSKEYENNINIGLFRYYRILITAINSTSYVSIGELELYEKTDWFKSLDTYSEQNFLNHGMELESFNPKQKLQNKRYIVQASNTLGGGKIFTHHIDVGKYKINKIRFK